MDALVAAGRIIALLERVCWQKRPCKFCARTIYFVRTNDHKIIPYTDQGENHFLDCPHFAKQRDARQQQLLDTLPDALEPQGAQKPGSANRSRTGQEPKR